jgi:type IV pilus assembly protein PilA
MMKKKTNKAFTLIELLVVVAIIGILAAVGVVAYNGYVEGAKTSSTKTIHSQVSKYVAAEVQKCNISGGKVMNELLVCSGRTPASVITALTNPTTGIAKDFKNPFAPEVATAIRNGGTNTTDADVGYISLSKGKNTYDLDIKSCNNTPCSNAENQVSTTVQVQ